MNKNKMNNRRDAMLLILAAVLITAIAIVLKILSPKASPDAEPGAPMRPTEKPVAIPDTTLSPDVSSDAPDSVVPAIPDSIGIDRRPPDEAGAEDGYWNGLYDGIAGQEQTEHDVTSNFPTEEERRIYADNYRESYIQGYQEGIKQKKQH